MKLIIGLGNPGTKYAKNRHNVGEMFVDWVESARADDAKAWKLLKLEEFMNDSGKGVRKLRDFYKLTSGDIVIVHDDLDLRFGENKLQFGKGPYGHNGLLSIEDELGTKDFWRLRIGIDNRDTENRIPGVEYTLHDFAPEESKTLMTTFPTLLQLLLDQLH